MKTEKKINDCFKYDKEKRCFFLPDEEDEFQEEKDYRENTQKNREKKNKIISFQTLYNSHNRTKLEKSGVEYILYNNNYYPFVNPYYIKFIFPDGVEKEIFIPRNKCIFELIETYKNYKYLVKMNGRKDFEETKIRINDEYSEIKFLPFLINKDDYMKTYTIIDLESNQESLSILSPVFDLYFENKIITQSNSTFKYSDERKQFFEFLEKEIDEKQLIPLCGPKGIGKTISILAFFRQRKYNYTIFIIKIILLFI